MKFQIHVPPEGFDSILSKLSFFWETSNPEGYMEYIDLIAYCYGDNIT